MGSAWQEVMLVEVLSVFLCAVSSWYIASLFTASPPKDAAISGAAAGVLSAALAALLSRAGVGLDLTFILLPFLALAPPIQRKQDWTGRLAALLAALGGYGMLACSCRLIRTLCPAPWALALSCLAAAVSAAAGYAMRGQFPADDWQEYFQSAGQEHMAVRVWHIWLALGSAAALEAGLFCIADTQSGGLAAIVLIGAGAALYWGALYAVCLMTAYRREKLTTLIDQDYRNEMQSFMSVIRAHRHDYNFHVQALAGLINKGDLDECRQYVNNLVRDSTEMNTILPIKDPAIAALIFSFRTTAREDGINLHLDIQNDLSCVVTSVYETNKVIGNLLQNAIDEVRTHQDKSFGIHLYILKRGENCIIHVANKIAPKTDTQGLLQEIYKPGLSTKEGHEGIGLSSVRNLLSRYRGVVYSRLEGNVIHFVAKIPLRL